MIQEQEKWKPILGYEKFYAVSNLGNVRSMERQVRGHNGVMQNRKGKVLTQQINQRNGYAQVMLIVNNHYRLHYVHRLVAQAFVENPMNMDCVTHIDGDFRNNAASNLKWFYKSKKSNSNGKENN